MKRRICVLLLAVMLALSLILCTGGMAEEKDFIVTVVSLADAFAKFENPDLYPERDIQLSELQEEIRSGQAPDLIITYGDIETLKELGAIVPFTPSEMLVKDFETMPPFIREATRKYLITEDGQFWGCIRGGLWLKTMLFYVPSAWADSPFHDRMPPTSFEEFLDFAELYLDTPHKGFCLLGVRGNEKYFTEWKIMNMLLSTWTIQQQYAGEPFRFTSDEFISLLDRTKKLIIRLQKEEPLINKKQKGLRELFTNPGGESHGGKTEVSRELYNWDHMIPYRIYASQPPLVNAWGDCVVCVCNPEADTAEVNRYMENLIRQRDWPEKHTVPYSAYTHPELMVADECNEEYYPEVKDGYMTQQWLDSIGRIQGVPCCISEYYFWYGSEDGDGWNSYENAINFIKNKKMTAEKYAQELERISQ